MTTSMNLPIDIEAIVTDEVVDEYWERGYWISPKLFDDEQIAALRAAHDRLWAGQYDRASPSHYGTTRVVPGSLKVRQQCDAFWLNDVIYGAVTSPIIGAIGAKLMRVDTVRLWHDQAIYKPGQAGQEVQEEGRIGWHQDYYYWQCVNTDNMCTGWVALQDTDLHNGGMRTIVGSHTWGLHPDSGAFHGQDLDALAQRFSQTGKGEWIDEPCIMKAGQVSFHHSLTFHGSGPNLSDQPRLSVVSHMMPGDAVYRSGQRWHQNMILLGPDAYDGQPFTGSFWPQMWPAVR